MPNYSTITDGSASGSPSSQPDDMPARSRRGRGHKDGGGGGQASMLSSNINLLNTSKSSISVNRPGTLPLTGLKQSSEQAPLRCQRLSPISVSYSASSSYSGLDSHRLLDCTCNPDVPDISTEDRLRSSLCRKSPTRTPPLYLMLLSRSSVSASEYRI